MSASPSPLLCVVLATWNRRKDTLECLDSLARSDYDPLQVVLVDNGSSDGTAQEVTQRHTGVRILHNESNRGFAAAMNQGIREGLARGAEYLLLLNNDTLVAADMIRQMMAYATQPQVGIVVPKILYHDRPDRIWSVGARLHAWTLEKSGEARGQRDSGRWGKVLERDQVTACALLLSRELVERIGLLDERFFVYYDDADLSLRARRAGYRILLVPQARVWHKAAATSGGVDTPQERYWMARSSVLFFRKHAHGWQWLLIAPYRLGSALKTTLRLVLHGRWPSLLAYWGGLRDGWRALPPREYPLR